MLPPHHHSITKLVNAKSMVGKGNINFPYPHIGFQTCNGFPWICTGKVWEEKRGTEVSLREDKICCGPHAPPLPMALQYCFVSSPPSFTLSHLHMILSPPLPFLPASYVLLSGGGAEQHTPSHQCSKQCADSCAVGVPLWQIDCITAISSIRGASLSLTCEGKIGPSISIKTNLKEPSG